MLRKDRTAKASKECMTEEQLSQQIREVAHRLYEKKGSIPGNDWNDWFEAEKIVKSGCCK